MDTRHIDAMLVTDINNVFYLSGFTGSTAVVVVTNDGIHILVDPRYSLQARTECRGAVVHDYTGKSATTAAVELVRELKPLVLGYEADQVTVATFRGLRRELGSSTRLRSTSGLVRDLRRIKDGHELALMREAVRIADQTFNEVLGSIHQGMSEKDLALLIDCTMRRLGADREGFETIVAAGPNAACPHASPTNAFLERGQLVKMDFGARYQRYNSDVTRTLCLGQASREQRHIYQVVLDAQLQAIEAISPGKRGSEIDAVARNYIASQGYGDSFGHGLGHGLGIEVHDGPGCSTTSDGVLQPGMVVTIEPGIYIDGWGGIRIEDDVLITDSGVEVLTSAPKGFTCV